MFEIIREKIKTTRKIIKNLGYDSEYVSVREFYDWMTREFLSEDNYESNKITLLDVLKNEYLMIHELIEINEFKKMGRKIDRHIIIDSQKEEIYKAHFFAQEFEMDYAFKKKDYSWIKIRLKHHKSVLDTDPNLPKEMRSVAQNIYEKFS